MRIEVSDKVEVFRKTTLFQHEPGVAADRENFAGFDNVMVVEHEGMRAVFQGALVDHRLAAADPDVFPALINPNTYLPGIKTPILLLNGSHDIAIHTTQSRDLLLQTIGTPAHSKRGIIYDAPHWPLPPHRVRDDSLAWLDKHAGPAS